MNLSELVKFPTVVIIFYHGKKSISTAAKINLPCTLEIHFYHGNTLTWLVGIRGKTCLAGSRTWEIDFYRLENWILPRLKLIFTAVTLSFDWLAFAVKRVWRAA